MRKDIHPQYYPAAKVVCSCGNTFETGSTLPEIQVEICSACHPFYTGVKRLVDIEGRVERFEKKRAAAVKKVKVAKKAKPKKEQPKTLKEMLSTEGGLR